MQDSPLAPKIPHIRNIHEDTVVDNWFWLRDRQHPETIPYLEAENRYMEEMTKASKPLEDQLYSEMLGRIQEDDTSCPWLAGNFEYYSRTERGKQYQIFCRREPGGPEEVMLDCNEVAQGHDYFSLAFEYVSPDGAILAFAINTDGSEVYTLRFKNLLTGQILPGEIAGVYYSAAWDANGRAFFYTTLDQIKRPHRLWRHEVGSGAADKLVFEEPDERFNVSVDRSRSGRFLFVTAASHTTTEARLIDAHNSAGELRLVRARRQDVEYFLENQGDWLYMRTNEGGKNFRLLRAPVTEPSEWAEVIPHRADVTLERMEAFQDHLVLMERAEGLKRLRIVESAGGAEHYVSFEEPVYTLFRDRNEQYATTKFRFVYASLTSPPSVFDYEMNSRDRELKKRYPVLGGYDPNNYVSNRVFARSHDGTLVPISLVRRRDFDRTAPAPLYLYGYGSYGIVTEPSFSSERVSLLDRGFIFAIAHVRGSGDMGRFWYEDGKLLKKKNTFLDFIACAEHLIANDYTAPDRLLIAGGSAGGLLMGAVANLRPDLFRAIVAHVPFVDVINTMLDPTLPLTLTEYEEWGNPNEREFYEYMRSYAPYENVRAADYPNMLVTAGLNDPRVPYWEPAKWVAKLRDLKTDRNTIILKTNMGAGHGGPSGRYEKLREKAFEYAFAIAMLRDGGNANAL